MSVPAVTVLHGHALTKLRELPDESWNCCVTSPPYWELRAYGTEPQIWGGVPMCEHQWGAERIVRDTRSEEGSTLEGRGNVRVGRDWDPTAGESKVKRDYKASTGCFCSKCGAWRGELGLEPTPELFVAHIVEIFREVRRVLRNDGTLWVNLGDCYATGAGKANIPGGGKQGEDWSGYKGERRAGKHGYNAEAIGPLTQPNRLPIPGLKPKDLVGMPWRVAFALQADGWYLRRDIIWSKPNPMPESVRDRPTSAHEYIFLLSKSEKYYYDADAIAEPCQSSESDLRKMRESQERIGGKHKTLIDPLNMASSATNIGRKRSVGGKVLESKELGAPNSGMRKKHCPNNSQPQLVESRLGPKGDAAEKNDRNGASARMSRGAGWRETTPPVLHRSRRSVWTIATSPYPGAHFATYPPEIAKICILAGCPEGGTVGDLFGGSGTTGAVALSLGRSAVLIELQEKYIPLIEKRVGAVTPGFQFEEVPA